MTDQTPIQPADAGWYPLTAGQMDFWEEFLFHPDQPVSTVAHVIAFDGALNEAALVDAIRQTLAETDTLALAFRERADGGVEQRRDPSRIPRLQQYDLRGKPDPDAAAHRIMRADMDAPLDLRRQPLSAQMLLRLGETRWFWYSRGHHIVLDGYGMSLIERRVAQSYAAAHGQGQPGAPFGRLADFLMEERDYADSLACLRDRAYWADLLEPHRTDLPVLRKGAEDYGAPPLASSFTMGTDFDAALQRAARAAGLNWADLLTLLSAIWLSSHDPGRRDPAGPVWLPYMSRMGSVSANIPAMVVNIMPLFAAANAGEPLADQIARLSRQLRQQRRHGRYRVEEMARDCAIPSGHRFHFTPLVNVMPFAPPEFHGVETRRMVLAAGPGDGFNISFTGSGTGAGLTAAIEAEQAGAGDFTARAAAFEGWLRASIGQLSQPPAP